MESDVGEQPERFAAVEEADTGTQCEYRYIALARLAIWIRYDTTVATLSIAGKADTASPCRAASTVLYSWRHDLRALSQPCLHGPSGLDRREAWRNISPRCAVHACTTPTLHCKESFELIA